MHAYKINVVLFFVLLALNIKTREKILEVTRQLQESGCDRFK